MTGPKPWRLLETGCNSGAFNMALDEVLLQEVGQGRAGPAVRLFGWDPPAVSFGYAQDPAREIDLRRCCAQGVDVVRRPTGGRAVLHWDELTYSLVCGRDESRLGGAIGDIYRTIGQCLVEGLRLYGVEVALERAARPGRPARSREAMVPCFSSIARWEIKWRGRKLVGSAQRRLHGAVLQHGSLLTGAGHKRLLDLLPPAVQDKRAGLVRQLELGSISLAEGLGRPVDLDELAACLAAGFRRCLQVDLEPLEINADQQRQIEVLQAAKYGDQSWTLKGDSHALARAERV